MFCLLCIERKVEKGNGRADMVYQFVNLWCFYCLSRWVACVVTCKHVSMWAWILVKLASCHADFLERWLQCRTLCVQSVPCHLHIWPRSALFSILCSSPFWFPPTTTPGEKCWDQGPLGWQLWGAGKKGWTHCSFPTRWPAFSPDTVDRVPEGPEVLACEHGLYQPPYWSPCASHHLV